MCANPKPTPEARVGLTTAAEAASFLKLSRTTLWRLERAGALQPVRVGRALRFRWSDLHHLARTGGGEK